MADAGNKGLRLYNTLTRTKEDFVPIDAGNVRMYACGPTVYDYAHIGNARPVIVFDVLFRLLRHLYGEDHVTYVRNITDVDDKINARAARDYPDLPLNEAIRKVTEETNAQYQEDVKALGSLEPTFQPRATEYIAEMRAMIERLVEVGVAYVAEDHVLFSPSEMNKRAKGPRYGALARRSLDEMLAGARVDVASYKRDEMDFVLWKPSKPGEPGWPSPSGITVLGRPGWHIECSAMSMAKLLEPFGGGLKCDDPTRNVFDIHAGGIDLVFPHHENEIAQSCCAFGSERMAKVWMHNGFLQVEGQKMSKSLGNFVTIHELLATETFGGRKWPGEVLRLAMLMTHYREPIDFSVSRLREASTIHADWLREAKRWPPSDQGPDQTVVAALADDLDTAAAKLAVDRLVLAARGGGSELSEKSAAGRSLSATLLWLALAKEEDFVSARDQRAEIKEALGVAQAKIDAALLYAPADVSLEDIRILVGRTDPSANNAAISSRLGHIRDKNWAQADRIRDDLLAEGIQLKDGKDPATGERITTWEVRR